MLHLHITRLTIIAVTIQASITFASPAILARAGSSPHRAAPPSVKLKDDTLAVFELYVKLTGDRNADELTRTGSLLWIDPLPERAEAYAAVRRGEVKVRRLQTRNNGQPIQAHGGMIHHWVGLAFIPNAKVDDVLSVLQDYNRHATYYAPDVERSKLNERNGDHFVVSLRFRWHEVITVVLDTVHEVEYFRDGPAQAHSRSRATRITQVENPGKPDERDKSPGHDDGFLWGMDSWWRLLEKDNGVYVQSEVVSLTRDIPTGLGWLIGPFVTKIPRESLTFTLEATRKAVEARTH